MICKFSAYAAPIIECNLDSPSGSRHRVGTVIQALTLSTEKHDTLHQLYFPPCFRPRKDSVFFLLSAVNVMHL
jgi:hypothetical protein